MHDVLNLLIVIGSLGALMYGLMKFMLRNLHKELSNIQSDVTEIKKELKRHDERMDHLYEISVSMLTNKARH